jgi:hypothetical protein
VKEQRVSEIVIETTEGDKDLWKSCQSL